MAFAPSAPPKSLSTILLELYLNRSLPTDSAEEPFFSMILAADDWISAIFSIRYDFARFPRFIANPFFFCYIMESRFIFFVPDPAFQYNYPYLKNIER